MSDRYLRAKEVARLAGCSDKTVKRWHQKGLLPGTKPGGATSPLRFKEANVLKLLDRNQRG